MPPDAGEPDLATAARRFSALGDPMRLTLLRAMEGARERSVGALAEDLPVSRQAVAKHLSVLSDAGLAVSRRAGRQSLWRARPEALAEMRRYLDGVGLGWEGALANLKAQSERR